MEREVKLDTVISLKAEQQPGSTNNLKLHMQTIA